MKLAQKTFPCIQCFPLNHTVRYFVSTPVRHDSQSNVSKPQRATRSSSRSRQADRDLLVDVLSSSATKRDARSYLSKYQPGKAAPLKLTAKPVSRNEVNLGRLFPQLDVPQSSRRPAAADPQRHFDGAFQPPLRAAIIVLRSVGEISDGTLEAVGHTFIQLSRLGLGCVLIVDDDCRDSSNPYTVLTKQLNRVVEAIESDGTVQARKIDKIFYRKGPKSPKSASVEAAKLGRIYQALNQDSIVVASPFIYGESGDIFGVNTNGAALSLAYSFRYGKPADFGFDPSLQTISKDASVVSLDRIIVIDPRGGLPNISQGGSHVFVNLEQEFDGIYSGLQTLLEDKKQSGQKRESLDLSGNERSSYTTDEVSAAAAVLSEADINAQVENLLLVRGALSLLPETSSALLATPTAAAFSANHFSSGVGTRSQRNPLIYSLLTDKPLFSSSLPRRRLAASDTKDIPTNHPSMVHAPPTHLKHGMPLIITPDPLSKPWVPPQDATFSLSLDDPRIDHSKLIALIEDSFGRQLDAEDYFARIRPRLAGIIVAGDYDGGAVLTWEQPESFLSPSPSLATGNTDKLVPYLDKFAVLKRAQGGGVADVVFSAMVRRCFPKGVCWRSRDGNPVNKWYFERSRGSLRLPVANKGDQAWTMFWTTDDLQPERLKEYAEVSLAVKSSWADGKKILD